MKSMPVLAMLAMVGLCAGCSADAGALKGESISFPTSAAATTHSQASTGAPAASGSPKQSASASAADPAHTGASSLPTTDAQGTQTPAQRTADGTPAADAGQQAAPAPGNQTGGLQQAAPAQTSQDSAIAGVAASIRASKQADGEAVSDSAARAYAQCLVSRAWNALGPAARADMAAGGDEDSWRLSEAEEKSFDTAKDHCEETTPGFD